MLLLTVSCLVALGIGELLARCFLACPKHLVVRGDPSVERRLTSENSRPSRFSFLHHPEQGGMYVQTELGRRLRANTYVLIQNHALSKREVEIRTNSLGYRSPEITTKTRPRVLFLGDSITFGDWLPEEETFVRLTQTIADQNGCRWETINAAVGGASLHDELAVLKETGLTVKPDVVVLGFYLNDFQTSPGIRSADFGVWGNRSWLLYHSFRAMSFWLGHQETGRHIMGYLDGRRIKNWQVEFKQEFPCTQGDYRVSPSAFNGLIAKTMWDWGGSWSGRAWELMRPLFGELKQLSRERGFHLLVVVFPVSFQIEAQFVYDFPQRQLKETCRELGIPVLDLLPAFREARTSEQDRIFYDHCHHTSYGNRLVALEIAEALRRISLTAGACARIEDWSR